MNEWFRRGVRLPLLKKPASKQPVKRLTGMGKLWIPLGAPNSYRLSIAVGDAVAVGQSLCDRTDSALCSADGVFEGVLTVRHPLLGETDVAVIGSITGTEPPVIQPTVSPDRMSADELLAAVDRARVIDELDGMPLGDKLRALREQGCALLIADAVEAEPYASSGWTLLRDRAEQVLQGLQWLTTAIGAERCLIALQNKSKHIHAMEERCGEAHIYAVSRLYPVDRYAPPDTDRMSSCRIGVQAVYAVYRAIAEGVPQTEITVTVAGDAVTSPTNLTVPIGSLIEDVIKFCGWEQEPELIVLGDVMTGMAVDSIDLPLTVGTTCLLLITEPTPDPRLCIGCGRCASVCHRHLLPYEIARELDNLHYERLPLLRADLCDGCGACSFVCPATRDVAAAVIRAQDMGGDMVFNLGGDDDE